MTGDSAANPSSDAGVATNGSVGVEAPSTAGAPAPRVLVGTCGWTDKTLVAAGTFYPPDARSAEARLRHYASRLPVVEVDSTYYAPPSVRNAKLWAARTPEGFLFDVKAYSLFTRHPTRPEGFWPDLRDALPKGTPSPFYVDALPRDLVDEAWRRFREALGPLAEARKLGAVMLQFPPWVRADRRGARLVLDCAERLEGTRVAVELRHRSWFEGDAARKTLGWLAGRSLPIVCVDMPQGFDSSVPPFAEATSADLAIVRFHGRNRETWEAKGLTAAERFRWLYSRDDLRPWIARIRALAERAAEVHVLFNNCWKDYAVGNAADLVDMLAGEVR